MDGDAKLAALLEMLILDWTRTAPQIFWLSLLMRSNKPEHMKKMFDMEPVEKVGLQRGQQHHHQHHKRLGQSALSQVTKEKLKGDGGHESMSRQPWFHQRNLKKAHPGRGYLHQSATRLFTLALPSERRRDTGERMQTVMDATSNREPPERNRLEHSWPLTFFMLAPTELLASSLNCGNLKDKGSENSH